MKRLLTLLTISLGLAFTAGAEACPEGYIQLDLSPVLVCTELVWPDGAITFTCSWEPRYVCIWPQILQGTQVNPDLTTGNIFTLPRRRMSL